MKIQNINFKKAFIVFFAALFVFGVVSVSYSAATGGWERAVSFQESRIQFRQGQGYLAAQDAFALRSRGHFGRGVLSRGNHALIEADSSVITARATMGDRILGSFAALGNRITSGDFSIFNLVGRLFMLTFNVLLAAWVYLDSQKRGKNRILWGVLTLFTSLFGWVLYLIVRENGKQAQNA